MKKGILILMLLSFSLLLAACGSTEKTSSEEEKTVEKVNFKKSDAGAGKFWIDTASGTSENGNVPVMFYDSDIKVTQLGINAVDFNAEKQTYIYVDGYLNDKFQLGTTQTSLNLKDDTLKIGKHDVVAVQYENNDPKTKVAEVIKTAQYEVKK
ncbi:hypothetical protein IA833_00300 [Listeria marthii]|uniref:hypothetical protein n=1 Tax=Listeria marthii TaxID=529731 RepID=UPI0018879E9C|nr:hypothetical protein [Listeria marthii]MBF2512844.1 hypothetical protein [Listeria marthii]